MDPKTNSSPRGMNMFIDIHAHLDFPEFKKDLDQVILRAKKAGVSKIICSGVNRERNENVLSLAKKHDIIEASLGMYPCDYENKDWVEIDRDLAFIEENKDNCVGIGEVGLDYSEGVNHEKQRQIFQKCIGLAKKLNKTLIIHSRRAEKDALQMLIELGVKNVVLHCFSANMKLVMLGEQQGFYFSIPPIIKFSHHFQKLVETVSLKNLLTETDSPYLSPIKGERNEPSRVIETVKNIARIKGLDEKEVAKNIFFNYQRLFS